jgi:hypothetical protein
MYIYAFYKTNAVTKLLSQAVLLTYRYRVNGGSITVPQLCTTGNTYTPSSDNTMHNNTDTA